MDKLIASILASTDHRLSNHEFLLYHMDGEYGWRCGIGNPSQHVSLGESSAEVEAEGATAMEALENLARELGLSEAKAA